MTNLKIVIDEIFSSILQITGWVFLFTMNWKIGLGTFLIIWGRTIHGNLEKIKTDFIVKKTLCSLESLIGIRNIEDKKNKQTKINKLEIKSNNGEINN